MVKTAFDMLDEREDEAEEPNEPAVEAVPRITREAFGYLEPRPGIDGLQYFGNCGSCQSFVSEAAMTGAVIGSRCIKFGSRFPVSDDDHCNRYEPWASGIPCEAVTMFYAGEIRKGAAASVSSWEAGYKAKTCVQCNACRFFDASQSPSGVDGECEAMEELNEQSPKLFNLLSSVKSRAWCSMWTCPHDDLVVSAF